MTEASPPDDLSADRPSDSEEPGSGAAGERPADRDPSRRRTFRIVLLILMLGLGLVSAELLLRALTTDVYLQRRLRQGGLLVPFEPNTRCELLQEEFRVRYDINRFGYRDRLDRTLERMPDKARVLLLGDSFSAGWGVEFKDCYGTIVEDRTGIEVVNAAKNGGCPLWFIAQARYAAPRFKPDLIIAQVFDNDIADVDRDAEDFKLENGRLGALPSELEPPTGLFGALDRGFDSLVLRRRWRNLRRRMKGRTIYREPYVRLGSHRDEPILDRAAILKKYELDFSEPFDDWGGDFGWHDPEQRPEWQRRFAVHEGLLRQLIKECAEAGRELWLVYIPARQVYEGGREVAEIRAANPHYQLLSRLGAETETPLIDGTAVFGGLEDPTRAFFARDGHLNALGHRTLAAALIRELKTRHGEWLKGETSED